jgi:choline dehydrogenase-like flavoprotein
MVYMRGNRGYYDHWAQLGNRGWSYEDVLPYFKRAENNARFRDAYHGTTGPLHVTDPAQRHPLTGLFMEAAAEAGLPYNKM